MRNENILFNLPLFILLLTFLVAVPVNSQELPGAAGVTAPEQAAADATSVEQIDLRTRQLADDRAALARQIAEAGLPANDFQNRVTEQLEQIELQLKAQAGIAQVLELQPQAAAIPPPADAASVYTLNGLYEQLVTAESALREKRHTLLAAREQLASAEQRAREARVTLEQAPPRAREASEQAAKLATLAVRLAGEQVNLATLEVRAAQIDISRDSSLQERIASLRTRLANGEGSADAAITALMEREGALQRQKNGAERQLTTAELRLAAAKQRYAENPQGSAEMLALVEALTGYRDATGRQIALVNSELDRLPALRETWHNWQALLAASYTDAELDSWETLASSQAEILEEVQARRRGQLADLQIRLESLDARISQLPVESQARAVLVETGQALKKLQTDLLASDRLVAADLRLTQRFLDDTLAITGNVGLLEYLGRAVQSVRELWSYEITTIDDAPFTVGSLTMGLLLFAVGLWASRLGAGAIGRLAENRLKLDAGAAQAMEAFSFYALLACFTLLALRAVHFPLTAFAFLGGALAIGIGFGSQNVMNNFISGLILMLERPVRAQDVVEVDGNYGVIQRIGPRSTQIRSSDGRHIVVPNSFFLESNVVNWTLSDELVRAKVTVGVAYGSPTRLVNQLIEEAVNTQPDILKDPAPIVIFESFGDNSLNFDVHFWVKSRTPMGMQAVQSKVRFAIDDAFREHDIVIAFPQRDVHMDTLSPIEVRMIGETGTPPAGQQPPTEKT